MAQKWTNADLAKVSKFGAPDISTFEPEQLNLDGFEPLENVDMRAPKTTPYTGDPNRQPVQAPEDIGTGHAIWNELNRPRTNVRGMVNQGADIFDKGVSEASKNLPDWAKTGLGMIGKYYSKQGRAAGNFVDSLSSDLGLLQALPLGRIAGVSSKLAEILHGVNRAAGAGFAVEGGRQLLDDKLPWDERAAGIANIGFGGHQALSKLPVPHESTPELTPGERLGKTFNERMKAPNPPERPNFDLNEVHQPKLETVNNDPFQYNLLDESSPFSSSARQMLLKDEPRPVPFTDTAQQPKLDLTPHNYDLPNEFLPDNSFESKLTPESQGAPRSLFEKPNDNDKKGPPPSGVGQLDPEKVPFKRVPDDILDEMIASKPNYDNPRLERVPLDSLRATQDTLNPDAVNDYIKQGDRPELTEVPSKAKGRMDDEAPVVIRVGDENILAGGHHRATADLANGKSDIQAVVYDAPNISEDLYNRLKASIERDKTEGTRRPKATPIGKMEGFGDDSPELYNIDAPDHPLHGSTVTADTLRENGIDVPGEDNIFPKEMRAKKKPENVAMGGADPRVLDVLGSSLYSKRPEIIAMKELLQNAIDEHKIAGSKDPIRTVLNHYDKNPITGEEAPSIEVGDRGRGLTKEQIYTVLTDVGKTGKLDEANASGGFGFAKASPMLGGKYARFISVVDEGGRRVKYTFEGSPEQLKNQEQGVPIKTEIVSPQTPTGFRAKVFYDKEGRLYDAKEFTKGIAQNSADMPSPVHMYERFGHNDALSEEYFHNGKVDKYDTEEVYAPAPFKQKQDTISLPGADVDIHFDTPDKNAAAQNYEMNILNNGMFQFGMGGNYSFRGALKGVPENIVANVRATVPEGQPNYPYTANREQLASHITSGIKEWVTKNLIEGARERQKQALRDMYNNMHDLTGDILTHGRARPSVLFDPDNLLQPEEIKALYDNPKVQEFATTIDQIINKATDHFEKEGWGKSLEKVGISLDPDHHGVWIPNPDKPGNATILLNPFNFIDKYQGDPTSAALEMMSTAWHEVGHTGNVENKPIDWSNLDTTDPNLGDFFKKYLDEVHHAEAVGDSGHGLSWLRSTAEVYARSGMTDWNDGVMGIIDAFNNETHTGYAPEIQDALRIYQERAGRRSSDQNILSRTGVSEKSDTGKSESIFGDVNSDGSGPVRPTSPTGEHLTTAFNSPVKWSPKVAPPPDIKPTKQVVKKIQQQGNVDKLIENTGDKLKAVKEDPNVTRDEKESTLEKVLNFQRTVLTSADLSAPGRQGLPLIGRKEWWTSWKPMFEALGSDKGYETVMDSIKMDPSGYFAPNAKGKSYANEAGLALTDKLDHREELFRSKFAEEFAGTKWFVKPSVRAYTAYLNKLRADTFKNMVNAAGAENNLPAAKAIADFINVATGRGSLGAFESAAKPLAQVFFSPRLAASRMQMYTRTFNPWYYANVPKEVRINQLKSMLALAGTGLVMGQLAKGIGAQVEVDDPYNSDFGKIKFGNTRIDPFAGHQQYLVAAARLLMGKTTSSTTGKTHSLTTGKFGMPNRASVFGNFMKNKLAPVPSFIWSWMEGKSFDGKDFNAKNEAMQRIVPIVTQDLYDIWKEDPTLLQGLVASGSAMIGGGVQTYGR